MDKIDYSEMLESQEVHELIDRIEGSVKNRILWRIFYKLYRKKGSFVNLFGQLMFYGGIYEACVAINNDFNQRKE